MNVPNAEQNARIVAHLVSRLGDDEGLVASVDALGILVHSLGVTGSPAARFAATVASAYMQAATFADAANGRKLTNEPKRKRHAALAELLRDAADQIERVVL